MILKARSLRLLAFRVIQLLDLPKTNKKDDKKLK
jgi:hypothetical protein